ncbi:MAG: hypothetical protein ABR557_06270 [Pyrinomonadaceae bacterium]
MNRIIIKSRFLPAAFLVLSAAVFAVAQQTSGAKQNSRPAQPTLTASASSKKLAEAKPAKYSYEFTQPQFNVRHIVIEHDQRGGGWITFEHLNEEAPSKEPLELSTACAERILGLWQSLRFLDSVENYQSARQFPHLGTMRLKMEQDSQKRTAEFNWTNNKNASALVNEYRRVADQAILVSDLATARENQPLNSPKLMEQLENMLRRNSLSDPQQLVPLLKEITTDEHLPLITRNHAMRLLKQIEKK